jgi:APA family basic amino acid/polyamine antiporter
LFALVVILLLSFANTRGLRYGKIVQNVFTVAKSAALLALIGAGIFVGRNAAALHANFGDMWHARGVIPLGSTLDATTAFGLFVALCVSQTGSLFSADSWHNIAFAAGEVREPQKNVTRAMVLGTVVVISLYLLANLAYLFTLPLEAIQHAPSDRVGTATLQAIFPGLGTALMAAAIMVSTFGTINALIFTGPRAYYAMARQRLFFRFAGQLNTAKVPAFALWIQGLWAMLLVLPRVYVPASGRWGNLYSDLLEYVISAALIFYILTVAAVFRLRQTRPDAPRPYKTRGYPVVPAAYIITAATILVVLFAYRPATTWPGLGIVIAGVPVYWLVTRKARAEARTGS